MAKPLDLAISYLMSFCGKSPLKTMETLFAEDLIFDGPFHKSKTAKEYLNSIYENPPKDAGFELEDTFENENSVCLIYMYSKPGVETRMAQTFEISDGRICKIRLIFDSNALT